MVLAASTCPRALAESVRSRTAKVSATPAIIDPSVLLNREVKYQAKFRSCSGAKAFRQVIAPSPPRHLFVMPHDLVFGRSLASYITRPLWEVLRLWIAISCVRCRRSHHCDGSP